jgi:hypothetical protein
MHTHLKGRVFRAEGTSFLVLHEDAEAPGWLRVREVKPKRSVCSMRVEEVAQKLSVLPPERWPRTE